jgi:hypothetical protein
VVGTETRLVRARKAHQCTERSYHTIKPGELYLYAACPPWHEMSRRNDKWWIVRTCLRCANEFGLHTSETRRVVESLKPNKEVKGC